MKYTTEWIRSEDQITKDLIVFMGEAGYKLNEKYGRKFNGWKSFNLGKYVKHGRVVVCRKDGKIIGFMLSRLYSSIFDAGVIVLMQDLLYALPSTRGSYYLMREFIDFGKKNANHIITMIGAKTNIKEESLEKRGFRKLETLYRLEV